MGQGLVWSLLIACGIIYTARAAVDGIFGSPPAGFYALLCSTDVKKFVEFYAYFLFCTDFNFVAHLGMM